MMKPHKSILKLVIERPQKDCQYTGQSLAAGEWTPTPQRKPPESPPPAYNRSWKESSTLSWSKGGTSSAHFLSDEDRTQPSQVSVCVYEI